MSNSIFRAFLTSFGNSFDFATNFNLYRFFSSLVKSLTKITKKDIGHNGTPRNTVTQRFYVLQKAV